MRFKFITAAILSSLIVLLSACDGILSVSGNVYEWVNPPLNSHGEIFVDKPMTGTVIFNPVEGAFVIVRPKIEPFSLSMFWSENDTTTANGSFHTFAVADPKKTTYIVEVSSTGYSNVSGEFVSPLNGKVNHAINVLLIKNNP